MANTHVLIASIVKTSAGGQAIFNSIPQTYTDLLVLGSVRSDFSSDTVGLAYATNSTTGITSIYIQGTGTTSGAGADGFNMGAFDSTTQTASTFASFELYLTKYTSTDSKAFSFSMAQENNGAAATMRYTVGNIANGAAISSLTFNAITSNFNTGSSFYLYGIKKS